MLNKSDYKKILSSSHKLFNLHLKETLHYKNLIFIFVKRDFTTRYKQTILGPLWAIINPLMTTLVFTVIFGKLAGLPTLDVDGNQIIPGFLFFMTGSVLWSYFNTTVMSVSDTFRANVGLLSKVYFPRIITPIATGISNLINFSIQLFLFFLLYVYFIIKGTTSICFSIKFLLFPLSILQMIFFAIGIGIIISSITTKYRDLNFAAGFILCLWQYATPVVYGLSMVSKKIPDLFVLYLMNPMTQIITTFRYAVFGFGFFNINYYLLSWAITLIVFVIGLIMFSRIERSFVDTI